MCHLVASLSHLIWSPPGFCSSLGAMANPMFALKGPKMKLGAKGYDTNFPLEHAQKDVDFAQELGANHGVNMSVSSAANGTFMPFVSIAVLNTHKCVYV